MTEYYPFEKQDNSTPRMSCVQAVATASQGVILVAVSANRKEQHVLQSVTEGKAARMSTMPSLVPAHRKSNLKGRGKYSLKTDCVGVL